MNNEVRGHLARQLIVLTSLLHCISVIVIRVLNCKQLQENFSLEREAREMNIKLKFEG